MNIVKTFVKGRNKGESYYPMFGIKFTLKDETTVQRVFMDTSEIVEPNTMWIDINKLYNEDFLKEHKIDYVLEGENKNIIPIGLVDFTNDSEYSKIALNICNFKGVELYKSNQVIKNIERAIEIKYEAMKFIRIFGDFGTEKEEIINLDNKVN